MVDRRTKADPASLGDLIELTEQEVADKEAENGLLQFDRMFQEIEEAIKRGIAPLTPEIVKEFQLLAVDGLERTAGEFRTGPVSIDGSVHIPPPAAEVAQRVNEMCQYVNDHWGEAEALHLAAYVMWRLNWIHPFVNGNGRTSRVASYLVLCAALGMSLPGDRTFAEIIDEDKRAYYQALDAADAHWLDGTLDVSEMTLVDASH